MKIEITKNRQIIKTYTSECSTDFAMMQKAYLYLSTCIEQAQKGVEYAMFIETNQTNNF